MSKISKTETDPVLSGLAELRGGVELLTQEGHVHTEMLAQIIVMLTPPERPPGPSLHELIVALIGRMDRQLVMLKEVIESLSDLDGTSRRRWRASCVRGFLATWSRPGGRPAGTGSDTMGRTVMGRATPHDDLPKAISRRVRRGPPQILHRELPGANGRTQRDRRPQGGCRGSADRLLYRPRQPTIAATLR
jgi:hypothetical protein